MKNWLTALLLSPAVLLVLLLQCASAQSGLPFSPLPVLPIPPNEGSPAPWEMSPHGTCWEHMATRDCDSLLACLLTQEPSGGGAIGYPKHLACLAYARCINDVPDSKYAGQECGISPYNSCKTFAPSRQRPGTDIPPPGVTPPDSREDGCLEDDLGRLVCPPSPEYDELRKRLEECKKGFCKPNEVYVAPYCCLPGTSRCRLPHENVDLSLGRCVDGATQQVFEVDHVEGTCVTYTCLLSRSQRYWQHIFIEVLKYRCEGEEWKPESKNCRMHREMTCEELAPIDCPNCFPRTAQSRELRDLGWSMSGTQCRDFPRFLSAELSYSVVVPFIAEWVRRSECTEALSDR